MKLMIRRIVSIFFAASLMASCGTTTPAAIPSAGSLIPNATVQVTTGIAYTSQQIFSVGVVGGVLYLIYDPLAPNWSIEEKILNEDTYALSLKAKSFRTGGDGEAMRILKRRALYLQRERGYASYKILDYSEGIESSTPLTHRFSEGTIQLVRAGVSPKR
ncbi:MAG: hypothetical protein WCL27_03650 [Betaproteobacteria bacterium]